MNSDSPPAPTAPTAPTAPAIDHIRYWFSKLTPAERENFRSEFLISHRKMGENSLDDA